MVDPTTTPSKLQYVQLIPIFSDDKLSVVALFKSGSHPGYRKLEPPHIACGVYSVYYTNNFKT